MLEDLISLLLQLRLKEMDVLFNDSLSPARNQVWFFRSGITDKVGNDVIEPVGFGFAAVLRDIGLPQIELPTALLFFNVGVEIGQLLFVAVLLVGFFLLRPLLLMLLRSSRDDAVHWSSLTVPASYVIGCIASYWLIDRVSGFW